MNTAGGPAARPGRAGAAARAATPAGTSAGAPAVPPAPADPAWAGPAPGRADTAGHGAASGTGPGGGAPSAGGAALRAFLAEGARRRAEHTRAEPGRPEFWADPDPAAAAKCVLGHPVDRALGRRKSGPSLEGFTGAVRRACERLMDVAGDARPTERRLTPEEVRDYPWHHIDLDLAAAFRESVYAQFRKTSTRNDAICAVRAVVRECYRAGLISPLRRDRLFEELVTVAPGPSSKRRRLTQTDINQLLDACETMGTTRAQARNTAIVALFRTSGIRVSELVAIDITDCDLDDGTIRLRDTKNGRDHLVFLHPDAIPYLERWIDLRGSRPGVLFTPLNRADTGPIRPISVRYMLRTRAQAAGVAPFGSHDFRRTFATELLRTHDVALVGKLLNHVKTASTVTYDLADEQEQRAAVARIQLTASDGRDARRGSATHTEDVA